MSHEQGFSAREAPGEQAERTTAWSESPPAADVASLLFENFRRRRADDSSSIPESDAPSANGADSLADLFRQSAVLRSLAGASASGSGVGGLPAVGDELFGFRLRHELGSGAFARVYLAGQANLADRPVVLKVSGLAGDEPQTLAQLQHTHIVPIYSVHENAAAGLRAVCMPYFGGASLSAVLQRAWEQPTPPARGDDLARALAAVAGPQPADSEATQPGPPATAPCPLPRPSSLVSPPSSLFPLPSCLPHTAYCLLPTTHYVHAAVWIVARLAEALEHAHQRRIFHRDIKPSNILLSADGQPMLLDFNLSLNMHTAQARASATLGGTVAYMAPEHLRALAARDAALARQVDERSDLYSLGMVLFEMLTGRRPFDQSASYSPLPAIIEAMAVERGRGAPSLRQQRRDIPWSLESIMRKCLAPDAARRYQRGEHLAEDLQRFLEDRPLRYAPELSNLERIRKWGRRHPRLTTSGSVAAAAALLLATAGAALLGVNENLASTRANLEDTQEHLDSARARERRQAFEADTVRALCLVNTTSDVDEHARAGLAVCEQALERYGVLRQSDWQESPDWQRIAAVDRLRLTEDVRELLLLLARGRRLHTEDPAVLRDTLALLDRADTIRGLDTSRAIWQERAACLSKLGDAEAAEQARTRAATLQPVSARDHYQLALTCADRGDRTGLQRAVAELSVALELNPHHYWSWMQRGICRQELGETTLAAGDYGACIGLWPEFAWGYFNRGSLLLHSGQHAEAVADFTAALERDPELVIALCSRGLARVELSQHQPALADFDRAVALGRDDAFLHSGRGMALEGLGRFTEADAAFERARVLSRGESPERRARLQWVYGFAVSARRPGEALRAFDEVLRVYPGHPQASYGRALLATRRAEALQALPLVNRELLVLLGRQEALHFFDQAVRADPGFALARRYRAIVLARCGRFNEAQRDVDWCLDREPDAGATSYTIACVSALAVQRAPAPLDKVLADQALDHLEKALAQDYGRDRTAEDPDLAGLRQHPRFGKLVQRGKR